MCLTDDRLNQYQSRSLNMLFVQFTYSRKQGRLAYIFYTPQLICYTYTGSALRLNGYVGHTIYIYHDIRTQSMNELLGCEALKEILHYITLHASRCLSAFTTSSPLKDVSRPLLRLISRTC